MALWITLGILLVLALTLISLYNRMTRLRLHTREAWAGIDVQLKRRHDLVPNLVEVVKGYASHEREVLENVTRLRAQAVEANSVESKTQAEAGFDQALKSLFALAEGYPDIKAQANFQSLQNDLGEIEAGLQNARRYYNAVVRDYNIRLATFPGNLVAGPCGFAPAGFFDIGPADAAVPKIAFGREGG